MTSGEADCSGDAIMSAELVSGATCAGDSSLTLEARRIGFVSLLVTVDFTLLFSVLFNIGVPAIVSCFSILVRWMGLAGGG